MAKPVTCSVCGASALLGRNAISVSDETDEFACDWHYGIERDENGTITNESLIKAMQLQKPRHHLEFYDGHAFLVKDE